MFFVSLISLILVLIGLITLKQNSRSTTNRSFFLVTFFLSFWIISNYYSNSLANYDLVLWANRFIFVSTTLLLFFVYLFSVSYPSDSKHISTKYRITLGLLTLVMVLVSLTSLLVEKISIYEDHSEIIFSNGIYLYLFYFILLFFLFAKEIFKKYRESQGEERSKIQLLILGFFLMAFGASITNLFLPVIFGKYNLSNIGPAFSIFLVSFTAVGIMRYQLFDIRLLIGKITYYLIAAIPAYFTYFMLAFIYESIFGTSFNTAAYIIGIPVALLFTAFVGYFNRFVGEYTDSHLINPGYNPLLVLEQLRERLAGTLDIERIIQEVLFIVARTIRPNFEGIIIIPENIAAKWISVNYKNPKFEHPEEFKSLVYLIQKNKFNPVTYEDLVTPDKFPEIDNLSLERIRSQMEKYKVSSVVPLRQDYKITGLLILGQKEADAPYTNQELKFLKSVATTASLAIGRALLYQEIQIFNETLQQKVNSATGELREKNKDLSDALAKLEDVRRQEKDMLDVMGHELRTPISIARNALFTLKKEVGKEEENKEKINKYADMAIESVRREIGLVEAFLSTTKLEADRMQVEKEKISLIELVNKSIDAHQNMAVKNKTEVMFHTPDQDTFVIADKLRVQEIMDNFLNNAIKYTGIGKVEVRIYKDGGLGWIDVKDNGIGISEEDLKKLGLKFFRARTLYNKSGNVVNPSGTGLGLFVSFNLIDLMGGQKKIVSKVGEGSTFSFGLPLASDVKHD